MRYIIQISLATFCLASSLSFAQAVQQTKGSFEDKFRQLEEILPTPNTYRNAAGAPGHQYWQQEVDYDISISLDENKRRLTGSEKITYTNHSPDTLKYLWLQLDQNRFKSDSMAELSASFSGMNAPDPKNRDYRKATGKLSLGQLRGQQFKDDHVPGYEISALTGDDGETLKHRIMGTNMRIDLPKPLEPGGTTGFNIEYAYNIVAADAVRARSGYEHFPEDERTDGAGNVIGNDIFVIAQWYPRLHAYTDYEAWTNKAFLGTGEFTLEFGDYAVEITVPADHIVASTGELSNGSQVLTRLQRDRLEEAETAESPVFIVTAEEALENEKTGTDETKTWKFSAENVRDFAWASSRKFIWDAQGYQQGGDLQPRVVAMSFYPKEGEPLWSLYSTASVIHTMKVYSRFSFDYPYPTAQSVNGPVGGMEYPMITFNGPRTDEQEDGSRTYTQAEKRFLIGVVIHEIGHIYFPMTVNSDERQWTWMDEGLNTFLEGVAEREWDPDIPWTRTEPRNITDYMKSSRQVPVMTQSDSVLDLGNNAYGKAGTALNILRETVLGRELFDFAFREYSNRWMFKRPTPSDFFRTMEEASGVDLDWFWHGWFYTTDHVDISLDRIYSLRLDTKDPDIDFDRQRREVNSEPPSLFAGRNRQEGRKLWVDVNSEVRDFYDENDRFTVTNKERNEYQSFLDELEEQELETFTRAVAEDKNYYVLEFSNPGGLVMPVILQLQFEDGGEETVRIPAEIWRRSPRAVKKLLVYDRVLTSVIVDPHWETADVDIENNYYPRRIIPSRVEAFKKKDRTGMVYRDIIQDMKTEMDTEDEGEAGEDAQE